MRCRMWEPLPPSAGAVEGMVIPTFSGIPKCHSEVNQLQNSGDSKRGATCSSTHIPSIRTQCISMYSLNGSASTLGSGCPDSGEMHSLAAARPKLLARLLCTLCELLSGGCAGHVPLCSAVPVESCCKFCVALLSRNHPKSQTQLLIHSHFLSLQLLCVF